MSANVRTVIRNFMPGLAGRGVNQLSGYIDLILAGYLPAGAVASLFYAQTIYLIPVSLFGMSISNAELPEMASQTGTINAIAEALCQRINSAMRRVAFFIVPSVAALLLLGDSMVALLYQTGKFSRENVLFVWGVLAGSTIGLLASTLARLYTSAFWALHDTRTPLRFASLRVLVTAGLGWLFAFPIPRWLGLPAHVGLIGLTMSAGMAGWMEFALLRASMNRRIGRTGLQAAFMAKLWILALGSSALAFTLKMQLQNLHPVLSGSLVLSLFGLLYIAGTILLKIPEATQLFHAVTRRFKKFR
jgi:putative peptidoglycan lipid II flippase